MNAELVTLEGVKLTLADQKDGKVLPLTLRRALIRVCLADHVAGYNAEGAAIPARVSSAELFERHKLASRVIAASEFVTVDIDEAKKLKDLAATCGLSNAAAAAIVAAIEAGEVDD